MALHSGVPWLVYDSCKAHHHGTARVVRVGLVLCKLVQEPVVDGQVVLEYSLLFAGCQGLHVLALQVLCNELPI